MKTWLRRFFLRLLFGTPAEHVSRVDIDTGAVLIFSVPCHIARDHAEGLRAQIEAKIPGTRAIILMGGLELRVVLQPPRVEVESS